MRAKFFRLTSPVLGKARAGQLLDAIERCAEMPHVAGLTQLLV